MRRRRGFLPRLLLLGLIIGIGVLVVRQGALPYRWSILPAIDMAEPNTWLLDWRLADLKDDRALCQQVLKEPQIGAQLIADRPVKDGCGWTAAVRISSAGQARLPVDALTCETAVALAMWLQHEVQSRAQHILGTSVTSVRHMGSYSCRNIVGSKLWRNVRSEHATANALDIAGFTLADGRYVSVLQNWTSRGPEARFLKEIHAAACRYFRVAIGPEFNAAHKDHFHYDRGFLSRCK